MLGPPSRQQPPWTLTKDNENYTYNCFNYDVLCSPMFTNRVTRTFDYFEDICLQNLSLCYKLHEYMHTFPDFLILFLFSLPSLSRSALYKFFLSFSSTSTTYGYILQSYYKKHARTPPTTKKTSEQITSQPSHGM